MRTGRIIRSDSGFYYVLSENLIFECKLRGKQKAFKGKGYPGDWVHFNVLERDKGIIESIEEKKTFLIRPPIANGGQLYIVMSLSLPELDYNLLDRLILLGKSSNISVGLILNKKDEEKKGFLAIVSEAYKNAGIQLLPVSAVSGQGMDMIKRNLENKLTILVGPSGVGESSILNALDSTLVLKTGSLGEKISRGRHTTRVSEFYQVGNGLIADTPGFSRLDLPAIEKQDLSALYDEFAPYKGDCQFLSCLHHKEKKCGVKKAVEEGLIDEGRYKRYLYFLEELTEREERRYK